MPRSLYSVIHGDLSSLHLIIASLAVTFAGGLVLADPHGGAYTTMIEYMPAAAWAVAFFLLGVAHYGVALDRVEPAATFIVSSLGAVLWVVVMYSFAHNRVRPMGSGDVMLLMVILLEIWCAYSAVWRRE